MIEHDEGRIGMREFGAILVFTIGLKITDTTPTLLFTLGKNAGWLIVLIAGITVFLSLLLLLKLLKRFPNEGLMEIVYKLMGKHVGFAVNLFLMLMPFAALIINSRSYVDILQSIYLPRTPQIVLYSILIGVSFLVARLGIEAMGNVAWILVPITMVATVVVFAIAWKELRFDYLFPLEGAGLDKVTLSGIIYNNIFGEIISAAVILPKIRGFKEYRTASIAALIVSTLVITVYIMVFVAMFDYPPVVVINYIFHTFTRLLKVGRFFTNLEAFFLIFWIAASIIRFSFLICLTGYSMAYTLKLKDFSNLLLPITALAMIIGMVPENFFTTIKLRNRFLEITSIQAVLPLILLVIAGFKGEPNK